VFVGNNWFIKKEGQNLISSGKGGPALSLKTVRDRSLGGKRIRGFEEKEGASKEVK